MPLLLTDTAREDIRGILDSTLEDFGPVQAQRYAALTGCSSSSSNLRNDPARGLATMSEPVCGR